MNTSHQWGHLDPRAGEGYSYQMTVEVKKVTNSQCFKDASHLHSELITSALMILSGSFKLETRRKVNENELRYNPKTLQTSSTGG